MKVTNLASFKEAREKKEKKRLRRRVRSIPRYLGGKVVNCAMDYYDCCHCIFPIEPGDQYRRDRYVRSYWIEGKGEKSYFRYERSHWPQCYGPTEEEDREIRDEIEREREAEREESKRQAA